MLRERSPWTVALFWLAALALVTVALTFVPGIRAIGSDAIERWLLTSQAQDTGGIRVTSAPFSLVRYLSDIEVAVDQTVDLRPLVSAVAWEIPGILRDSGYQIEVGEKGSVYDLELRWNSGAGETELELLLRDALDRPIGHWKSAAGSTGPLRVAGGSYRVVLTTEGRLGEDFELTAGAIEAADDGPPISAPPTRNVAEIPTIELEMAPVVFTQWDAARAEALATLSDTGQPGQFSNRRFPADLVIDGQRTRVQVWQAGMGLTVHVSEATPSFAVRVRAGPLVRGLSRFKLFSIRAENGLLDYVVASLLHEEGILVPRKLLANVTFNGRNLGLYLVEEMPKSQGFFEAMERYDGQITSDGKLFVDSAGVWERKPPLTRAEESSQDFPGDVDQTRYAKTVALMSRFHATHGMLAPDFRLYRSVLMDNAEPWVRDINVANWPRRENAAMLLTHARWWLGPALV